MESGVRVSTEDFIANYETLAARARVEPVTITMNGQDHLVVLSAAKYDRVKRYDRQVLRSEELTDRELALIAEAKAADDDAHLDAELGDGRP
ncbi:MAG: type II toxin-antitoxin system Phd/YefM family antitoxin [Gemmatimonadaceae bacterium]|nr:type II toxin-antitoxin system Phd/YefM family antitoxin [Caulobacter sp.]